MGDRGNYKAGMARHVDGRLFLAICRNNNDPDPLKKKFLITVYVSGDEGINWQKIPHSTLYGKEPSLAVTPDGTLVLTAQGGYFGPGADRESNPCYRSKDAGRTWETFPFKGPDYPRNLWVEKDGTLMMALTAKCDWYGEGHGIPNLIICRSKNSGETWTRLEGKVDWDWAGFGENAVIRLQDGRLLAALRRQIPGTEGEGFEDSVITESLDDGKIWSKPWQLLTTAQVHAFLTELADGRILCTYSNYHVPFGVSAVLTRDKGKTWDWDHPVQLAVSNGFYVGWAVTLQLPDKSLVTSYALTSHCGQEPDKFSTEVVKWHLPG
ncbi:MAG: sialidase family protein [Fibrobacterota bacterium]